MTEQEKEAKLAEARLHIIGASELLEEINCQYVFVIDANDNFVVTASVDIENLNNMFSAVLKDSYTS